MKSRNLFLLVGFCLTLGAFSQAQTPISVDVDLEKALVPAGFDDNDRIQIMVQGRFPSTCYKVGQYFVEKDESRRLIRIRQTALQYSGPCLRMIVPFVQVIDVGIVRGGNYSVFDARGSAPIGSLPVARSKTAAPDDYLYAPISGAHIDADGTSPASLVLKGNFPNRCMRLKEVKIQNNAEVIVVQPIAESLAGGKERCTFQLTRFSHSVALPAGLKGQYLLHVRSMEGKAINELVDIP